VKKNVVRRSKFCETHRQRPHWRTSAQLGPVSPNIWPAYSAPCKTSIFPNFNFLFSTRRLDRTISFIARRRPFRAASGRPGERIPCPGAPRTTPGTGRRFINRRALGGKFLASIHSGVNWRSSTGHGKMDVSRGIDVERSRNWTILRGRPRTGAWMEVQSQPARLHPSGANQANPSQRCAFEIRAFTGEPGSASNPDYSTVVAREYCTSASSGPRSASEQSLPGQNLLAHAQNDNTRETRWGEKGGGGERRFSRRWTRCLVPLLLMV